MANEKIVWSDCKTCARSTRHEILSQQSVENDPHDYHYAETWQIVRCMGCLNVGFRYQYDDYENVWEDEEGNYRHDTSVSTYPKTIKNHKQLDSSWHIPPVIRNAYKQTLSAYGDEAFVLASVGLRATIEAVCNHLSISGNSLEKRIDQLFKGGYVSNEDKKRLHAIRFLGNDAAHEIKDPKESELRVALEIVEHILNSVFILKKKAESLETVVENYDEFLNVLAVSSKQHQAGQVMSLSGILGRKRRLVSQNFSSFETQLGVDISSGKITYLLLDQKQKIDGRDIQLYAIGDTSGIKVQDKDVWPF